MPQAEVMQKFPLDLLRRIRENHVMEVVVNLEDDFTKKLKKDTMAGNENSQSRTLTSKVKLGIEARDRMLPILERLVAKPESYKHEDRITPKANLENHLMHNKFFNAILMRVDEGGLLALNKVQGVRSICENFVMKNASCDHDSRSRTVRNHDNISWGIKDLEIEKIWGEGFEGEGMRIGHLDSGVYENHPDLSGKVDSFITFNAYFEPVPSSPFETDPRAHGTKTAGVLVGGDSGGIKIGVAPKAKLVSAIAAPNNETNLFLCLSALSWMALEQKVDVVNISLGITHGYFDQFDNYLEDLRDQGVLTVCAIGNHGIAGSVSPGHNRLSCSVGAYDEQGNLWDNSAGAILILEDGTKIIKPDLVAPGVSIHTASLCPGSPPTPAWDKATGTSLATPFVAASMALLKAAYLTQHKQSSAKALLHHIERAIYRACDQSDTKGRKDSRHGIGYFQPFKAFKALWKH
jgi:subtilisin family serine protease